MKLKLIVLISCIVSLALMVGYDSLFSTLSQEIREGEVQALLNKKEAIGTIEVLKGEIHLPENRMLVDTNGNQFLLFDKKLQELQIINFWASWCAPCLKELPALFKLAKEYKNEVRVLAISIDENVMSFNKLVSKLEDKYSDTISEIVIARDVDKSIAGIFNTTKVPESFIVQSSGKVTNKAVGYLDWQEVPILNYISENKRIQ